MFIVYALFIRILRGFSQIDEDKPKTIEEERHSNYLHRILCDHVSCLFQNDVPTVYLYRDEIMNDDLISKLQDELYPRNWDIKVIYNWN